MLLWRRLVTATVLCLSTVAARCVDIRIPVVLSTDVGNEIDDQWAITYLLLQPRFEVLGIMSAHAPSIAAPAGRTSLRILTDVVEQRLGMAVHPPLIEGGSLPLGDAKTPRPSPAVTFLIETSRRFSKANPLTVLAIGASTDVASAILTDPSIVNRIKIVQMGFVDETSGKEFNIENDNRAEQVLLESNVPLTIGPASVCRRDLIMSHDHAREFLGQRGPIGAWLLEEYEAWYYRFVKPLRVDDLSKPWYIWDTITLAYVLGLTEQHTLPTPRLADDGTLESPQHPDPHKTVTWITKVDSTRMWADFAVQVDEYQRTHAMHGTVPAARTTYGLP